MIAGSFKKSNFVKYYKLNDIIEINGKREIIYSKKKLIGTGTFANVFYCEKQNSKAKYAIKIIPKSKLKKNSVMHNQVD
jgi:serine/threonine protein kinase